MKASRINKAAVAISACLTMLSLGAWPTAAQESADPPPPPDMPALEDVLEGKADSIPEFVPTEFKFRIGVIGEYAKEVPTAAGEQIQIKTPLVLINPSNGDIGVYAKNFPARIITSAPDGSWVVGVAPSGSVEGSSGSRNRECAVGLNMDDGMIKTIEEFPIFSKFQAFFAPKSSKEIYYCTNEPAAVNKITRFNLKNEEATLFEAEGNRFYLYGLKPADPPALWIEDPASTADYPVLNLIALEDGAELSHVEFPGARQVLTRKDGKALLAIVESGAEAGLGYYLHDDETYHQVPELVLTRPTIKWTNHSLAVIAKESTTTRDRFLWIDLATGEARELCSGYFKITHWDISPDDDALVFIVSGGGSDPVLYVVPLEPGAQVVNRIRLSGVSEVSWIGCLTTPSRGGWLKSLLPF
jgi:hypothetical protein